MIKKRMKIILNFILLILLANYRSALAKVPSCEDYGYSSEECGYGSGFFSDFIGVTALIIVSIVFIFKFLNSKEFRKNFIAFISGIGIIFISILVAQKYGEKIGAIIMGVIWLIYLDKFINWWFELFGNKNKVEQTTHLIKNKEQNKEQKVLEKASPKKTTTNNLENYECQYCKNHYRLSSFIDGKNINEIKCPNCLGLSKIENKIGKERNRQLFEELAKYITKKEQELTSKYIDLCKDFNKLSPTKRYQQVLLNSHLLESCEYRARDIPTLSDNNFNKVKPIYTTPSETSSITPEISLITFMLWRGVGTKYSEGLIEANWQILCDSADYTKSEYLENEEALKLIISPLEGYNYWIY